MTSTPPKAIASRSLMMGLLIALLVLGLPLAVWLDLSALSEARLRRQAIDLNSVISSVRAYYGSNVVGRVLSGPGGQTRVVHNYENIPGAIPIPATLSLELGRVINEQQQNISYRFVSDYPFANRTPHVLDDFEKSALTRLRANPQQPINETTSTYLTERVRLIAPVIMGAACVSCHNTHPESPKRDWKVGDVRGIQEVVITQRIASNIFAFKYLLGYFVFLVGSGIAFIGIQQRQAATIRGMNRELETSNEFLASLSMKISRYLSPQIYKSIFSGQRDVTIHTERKKLTIFFSDIKDFTATTERMQPEQITLLLNEYFTEMSSIALRHGGTIDKFVGDAILIFFGDPETAGEAEDAKACVRMALDMQNRLTELYVKWRNAGTEQPFRVRMGINTGYCNVGNFGSADRMDYTIIGAEANLAARLQSIAEPGAIVMSYETYAVTRGLVMAQPLPPITMKGISREVVPYLIEGALDTSGRPVKVISEHVAGLDLYLDPSRVDAAHAQHIRRLLENALKALERTP